MYKRPWDRATYTGPHSDTGGGDELQTDVMRFMAILAFCLVAMFAIVQSIPLARPPAAMPVEPAIDLPPAEPVEIPPVETPPIQAIEMPTREPEAIPPPPRVERPSPSPAPPVLVAVPKPAIPKPQPPATKPAARTSKAKTAPVQPPPAPQSPPQPSPQRGFSLRFESDSVLRSLVERQTVGLYAVAPGRSWRMLVDDQHAFFVTAQSPTQFHEMSDATVPDEIVSALRRSIVVPERIKWGVTLPRTASAEIDRLLSRHTGGALVIRDDGRVELEDAV